LIEEETMKKLIGMLSVLVLSPAFAADPPMQPAASAPAAAAPMKGSVHRYMVERTFPAGALKGLDAAAKKQVNANNATVGVRWIQSYSNADETKTFCIYEGPSEAAVRKAAELNKLPVDSIMEVPVTLRPR
jgi:Nickel responsive protein SCO4226-like